MRAAGNGGCETVANQLESLLRLESFYLSHPKDEIPTCVPVGDQAAERGPCGSYTLRPHRSVARRGAGAAASSAGGQRFRRIVRPSFPPGIRANSAHPATSHDGRRSRTGRFSASGAIRRFARTVCAVPADVARNRALDQLRLKSDRQRRREDQTEDVPAVIMVPDFEGSLDEKRRATRVREL
jgi:hypothetical protein